VIALLIVQINDVKLCYCLCEGEIRVQENVYLRHKNSTSQTLINPYKMSSQQLI